jgi:hypothetical protein
VTDTPIYDQIHAELNSRHQAAHEPAPRQRSRAAEKPAAPAPRRVAETTTDSGQPVSVWTLVNANRRSRKA